MSSSRIDLSSVFNNDNMDALIKLSGHPVRLLLEGGKFGLNSAGKMIGTLFLFLIVNFVLVLIAAYKFLWIKYTHDNIPPMLFVVALGVACLCYAFYRSYKNVILDVVQMVYRNASPLFHVICGQIVSHAVEFLNGRTSGVTEQLARLDEDGKKLEQIINVQKIIADKYGKAPKLIRRSIEFVLRRIPVAGILIDMKDVIASDGSNQEKATMLLHQKIDKYVEESIFSQNNLRWVFWLLPLNIAIGILPVLLK